MAIRSRFSGTRLSIGLATAALCAGSAGLMAQPAAAATVTYTVTQPVDDAAPVPAHCPANAVAAGCTLRDAVQAAVLLPRPSASNIVFGKGGQYTLTHGPIVINSPGAGSAAISITGFAGAAGVTILDGNNASNIFSILLNQLVTLSLSNMTLQHGSTSSTGGAIFNGSTLNLSNVVLSGNFAAVNGGAIENAGKVTIDRSTLSGNIANGNGGAIDEEAAQAADLTVTRSTLSQNVATNGAGGAIANFGGLTQLFNDTLYSNAAQGTVFPAGLGGAVFAAGSVLGAGSQGNTELTYATLAANSARAGGGFFNDNVGGASVRNSILSASQPTNCAGTQLLISRGYNLQFGGSAADSCQFVAQGKPEVINQNPLLGPPAPNVGVTLNMLPGPGSPAIDAIPQLPNTQCPLGPPYPFGSDDQRLLARPQGSACDIGAVETPAAASSGPGSSPPPLPPNTGAAPGAGSGQRDGVAAVGLLLVLLAAGGLSGAICSGGRREGSFPQ